MSEIKPPKIKLSPDLILYIGITTMIIGSLILFYSIFQELKDIEDQIAIKFENGEAVKDENGNPVTINQFVAYHDQIIRQLQEEIRVLKQKSNDK